MKSSLDVSKFKEAIVTFFKRFHTIIFFLLVSLGLFVAILMLLSVIELSNKAASSSDQVISGAFDETTIQRIQQKSFEELPAVSRISPFVE